MWGKNQADNHFWAPPVDCISLELNLSQFPLDKLPVRRAISAAIDRDAISLSAEGGYAPPATTSTGLVLPTDSQYLTAATTGDIRSTADPTLVDQIMHGAGYHRVGQGYWSDRAGRGTGLHHPGHRRLAAVHRRHPHFRTAAGRRV